MRTTILAAVLVVASDMGAAYLHAAPGKPPQATSGASSSIVVAPFFRELIDELLALSPTLRAQYDRIVSTPRVRVWVDPMSGPAGDSHGRAAISRSTSGVLLARVELATPLRVEEYAEMLGHELEHVLEQIEGVSLSDAADRTPGRTHRLPDGSYETERARLAGRAAAEEVEQRAEQR